MKYFENNKQLIINKLLDSYNIRYEDLVAIAKIAEVYKFEFNTAVEIFFKAKEKYDFEPNFNWIIWNLYQVETYEKVEEIISKNNLIYSIIEKYKK